MAAPTFIQEAETVFNDDVNKTTAAFNVQTGDILVAVGIVEDSASTTLVFTLTDNTGGAITWTSRQKVLVSNHTVVEIWTAPADSNRSMTVSLADNSTGRWFGLNVLTFRGSDGVGASVKENATSEAGGPSLNITTTQANSAIVAALGDWNATAGTRTWLANAGAFTAQTAFLDGAHYWAGLGYHADAGAIGTYAVGQSAPTGQIHSLAAVEIKGSATTLAFDAASSSGYQTADANYLWSHTCTGSDRYLTVGISMLSVAASSVTAITYAGQAMSFLGAVSSGAGAVRSELWGLVAPATGANNIDVTLSTALDSIGQASSYTNVHQTSPTEAFNSATATNGGSPADATVSITTVADNDWVVDLAASTDTAITVGAGQTQTGNTTGTLGSGAMSYEGPKTPAGAVTMSWTNVAALATWSIGGIALRPLSASGGAATKSTGGLTLVGVQ